MLFDEVIRKREACRKFSDYKLNDEELDKIIEAGRIAPSAKNNQPIKIFVCRSEEALKKIDEVSPCRYGAPQVLLICGLKDQVYKSNEGDTLDVDCAICATHMMLEATNIGIDNIWIRMFDDKKLIEAFNLDDNLKPVCLIPMGKRSEDAPISPKHNIRKDKKELVEYI
ncbi:MAG: nitroreductase family protein [Bacilli bacterium]|nr:nitroreductase family protein [Bacilli bacterium]